jgi:hypothetical protein
VRIGSLDNDNTAFSRVSDLAVDSRRQVYVLELGGTSVRVFSPDGNLLQVIGTRGSGPGEILGAAGMEVDKDDRLWLADAGNARYTVFNLDGSVARSQRWLEVGMMLPRPIAFDRSGHLLSETAIRIGATRFQDILLWLDQELKEVARLEIPLFDREVYELRNSEGRLREIIEVPFAPWLVWSGGLAGEVWMGVNDRYALARVTMAGDTTLILSRRASPMRVSAEEKVAALERFRPFLNGGGRIDDSRIPPKKPLFQSVFVDDDAHIWVRQYVIQTDATWVSSRFRMTWRQDHVPWFATTTYMGSFSMTWTCLISCGSRSRNSFAREPQRSGSQWAWVDSGPEAA